MLPPGLVQPFFRRPAKSCWLPAITKERRRVKRDWNADELAEHWTLPPGEKPLLANKTGPTRLGFAILLKFFQHEGCFPQHPQEIPDVVVRHVARQVDVEASAWPHYRWQGRTVEYHRAQIRTLLGFREATVEDGTALTAWLVEHVLPHDQPPDHLHSQILERCRALHIEPPSSVRTDRGVWQRFATNWAIRSLTSVST
jgi:hypothetical protein